jgi:hypothetical protein
MERFIDIVKRYPLLIAGAVVALILIIWYMSSGGTTANTIAVIGPSDTTVAANAAIESERIKANATAHAGQIAVELAGIDAGVAESTLSTSRAISEIQAARDVDLVKASGVTQVNLATIVTGASTAQAQISADALRDLATIEKNRAAQQRQYDQQAQVLKQQADWSMASLLGSFGAFTPAPPKPASITNISIGMMPGGIASDIPGGQGGVGGNQGNAQGGGGPF